MWFGFDDVFTGPVDELIVLGILTVAVALGAPGAEQALQGVEDVLSDLFNAVGDVIAATSSAVKDLADATKTEYSKKFGSGYKVYEIYDEGELIYIGITKNPKARERAHRKRFGDRKSVV